MEIAITLCHLNRSQPKKHLVAHEEGVYLTMQVVVDDEGLFKGRNGFAYLRWQSLHNSVE